MVARERRRSAGRMSRWWMRWQNCRRKSHRRGTPATRSAVVGGRAAARPDKQVAQNARRLVTGCLTRRCRAALLAGTVVVERVFSIPGLGNIFIQSVLNRDEPLTLGIVAFLSVIILIFNLLVDVAYGFIDPRIRY